MSFSFLSLYPLGFLSSFPAHSKAEQLGTTLEAYAAAAKDIKFNSTTPPTVGGGIFSFQSGLPPSASTSASSPASTGPITANPTPTSAIASPTQSTSQGPAAVVLGGGKMALSAFGAVLAVGLFGFGLI
jgi:hypothetical protein